MIMDAQLLASDGQAITTTTLSTNVIDLGLSGRDVGRGQPVRALARVTTAFTGGTSIRADLVESEAANLAGATTVVQGVPVLTANAGVGASLADLAAPRTTKRYLGFSYVVVGTMSGGAVTAGLVLDTDGGPPSDAYTGL